jgi:hypothetical protein
LSKITGKDIAIPLTQKTETVPQRTKQFSVVKLRGYTASGLNLRYSVRHNIRNLRSNDSVNFGIQRDPVYDYRRTVDLIKYFYDFGLVWTPEVLQR